MDTWRDKTFGETGRWIWLTGMAPLILVGLYAWAISLSSYLKDAIVGGVLLLTPAAWACIYLFQIRHVLQEIVINENTIMAKYYFGRRIMFVVSEIQSIDIYRMTWLTRNLNFLDRKNPGIDIKLKNGETLRVSHKMDDFSGLVKVLKARSARS
jgi:hypothetical protein